MSIAATCDAHDPGFKPFRTDPRKKLTVPFGLAKLERKAHTGFG